MVTELPRRLVVRTFLVGTSIAVAWLVPFLEQVMGVVGAVTCVLMCIIFPVIFIWRIQDSTNANEENNTESTDKAPTGGGYKTAMKVWFLLLLTYGACLMGAGIYFAVGDFKEALEKQSKSKPVSALILVAEQCNHTHNFTAVSAFPTGVIDVVDSATAHTLSTLQESSDEDVVEIHSRGLGKVIPAKGVFQGNAKIHTEVMDGSGSGDNQTKSFLQTSQGRHDGEQIVGKGPLRKGPPRLQEVGGGMHTIYMAVDAQGTLQEDLVSDEHVEIDPQDQEQVVSEVIHESQPQALNQKGNHEPTEVSTLGKAKIHSQLLDGVASSDPQTDLSLKISHVWHDGEETVGEGPQQRPRKMGRHGSGRMNLVSVTVDAQGQ
eukprot:gnl/MRDRNA2_/MRDRNA2_69041_c0_seq2.p1 gnl/MRDRNA2_/MRDRNA2_69041_c0~~gnl/MRDRNA2_/MRDRNA2_69041_c0_seq2.p1  ORF type:complete len:376 (-),score=57.43 gnl/MRDRNA2_/MRDRNA2_69041_c0_seq2:180-1307(-)